MQNVDNNPAGAPAPVYDFVEPDPPTVEDFSDDDDAHVNPPRGDHWDEETGLYVCGRCGRMWDGGTFYCSH